VAHFAPFASDVDDTAVTVRVSGMEVLTDFKYGDTSDAYVPVPANTSLLVEVVLPGGTVAVSDTFTLTPGTDYTVSAIGDNDDQPLELFAQVDDNSAPAAGQGKVRITHLAPFTSSLLATEVDIRTDEGTVIVDDVPYKGFTDPYLSLPTGPYDLQITTPDGTIQLLDIAPFTLTDGEVKSAFAIGDLDNQPLEVVLLGQVAATTADVWVAHFAPFASEVVSTAVTVRVNGMDALTDFKYGDTSNGYVTMPALPTLVEVVLPDGTVAISDTFPLAAETDYTVSAIGDGVDQPLELFAQVDDNSPPPSGEGKVRITHLAPFTDTLAATEVDIRTNAGDVIVDDVPYKGFTDPYLSLPTGPYDLQITTPDGTTQLLDIAPFTLTDGEVKSAFAIGDLDNQPLEVVLLSQVAATTADVWVAHFAPFASDVVSTAVTVRVNGMDALTDFKYGDTSNGYVTLPAIPVFVEIVLPGGTVAISDTFPLAAETDYTVSAIGDGVNQPLELFAQVDDNSPPPSGEGKVRITHLAPFTDTLAATEVDIRTNAGDVIVDDVPYKGFTDPYLSLPTGLYDVKITTPDGVTDLLDLDPFLLTDGQITSFYAIGDLDNQPLEVVPLTSERGAALYLPLIFRNFGP
jgi:hypothetical protein